MLYVTLLFPNININAQQSNKSGLFFEHQAPLDKQWPHGPLRGVNVDKGNLTYDEINRLHSWGVNLLRVSLENTLPSRNPTSCDENVLTEHYGHGLKKIEKISTTAKSHNIRVIITVSDVIGRETIKSNHKFFKECLVALWRKISREFKDQSNVIAYDILNEPHESEAEIWKRGLADLVVEKIREEDQFTYILYEPSPWALPDQGFDGLEPLKDKRVIYSFHYYYPHTFTHQGIKEHHDPGNRAPLYPGLLRNFPSSFTETWNIDRMRASIENAINFQRKYNIKILVGEFGVVRWADGADRWLGDAIAVFEENNWSWCFHSYGDKWNGWNPTFSPNAPQGPEIYGGEQSPSLQILMKWWARN